MDASGFRKVCILAALLVPQSHSVADDAEFSRKRGILVEEVANPAPEFLVRVSVDRKDRTYFVDDFVTATVQSGRAGYLYLVYLQADGSSVLLFPNAYQADNRIRAFEDMLVPGPRARFRLRVVDDPLGAEVLKAIVTSEPIDEADFELKVMKKETFASLSESRARGLFVEGVRDQAGWAEHHIEIETKFSRDKTESVTKQRVAVCIGISEFESPVVPDLNVCHNDAREMASLLKAECEFDRVRVLVNGQATRESIRQIIRTELVDTTRPGDEILIYWSGHGTRIADDNGDEVNDGMDAVLIPYDAQFNDHGLDRDSVVTDDTFGRWLQDLDDRRILVILDSCFSAGQSSNIDAPQSRLNVTQITASPRSPADSFNLEFSRARDIGQRGLALLTASSADEQSYEREEGDLSVMTHFLIQRLKSTPTSVTLSGLFPLLKSDVEGYNKLHQQDDVQTPALFNDVTPEFVLKR